MKHQVSIAVCGLLTCFANAQSTERVSVNSSGVEGNRESQGGWMSSDGRYVLFDTEAQNFDPQGLGTWLPFVHDRTTGQTILVGVNSAGAAADHIARSLAISADGQHVLFYSSAQNLAPGDVFPQLDIFVRDISTGQTSVESVDSIGVYANADTAEGTISGDGRYVAFVTTASNLVPGDTNGQEDVFVRDRQLGQTTRVSVSSSGAQGNGRSSQSFISPDGRYVVFTSAATNLVPGDTNGFDDIFLRDRLTGQTTRVNVDSAGAQAVGGHSLQASISSDGRRVAFVCNVPLVGGDTNNKSDAYVRDLPSGQTFRVSVQSSGIQSFGFLLPNIHNALISGDGEHVIFHTGAEDIVPHDPLFTSDIFMHDLGTGQTTMVNRGPGDVQSNNTCIGLALSHDGLLVALTSAATNLVVGDTNGTFDVFVRDRGSNRITPFCAGDGSAASCPCANNGSTRHGCATSLIAAGGYLGAYGVPKVSADTLLFVSEQVTGNVTLFYQGDARQNPTALDDGLNCVGGSIIRLAAKLNSDIGALYPEPGDTPVSVKGLVPAGGGTRYYQGWYRNANTSFCTPATTNRTNGLIVVWAP